MPSAPVNEISLFYAEHGAGDAVVLLHGLGSSGADWVLQLPLLAPEYRVIAVDLRGHGQSNKPAGPYSIGMFADDVAALIDHLGIGPAHVVGLSLGAMVTLELAATRPELVRSAVVVNAGPEAIPRTVKERAMVAQRKLLTRIMPLETVGRIIAKRTLPGVEHSELRDQLASTLADNDKAAYQASLSAIIGWSVVDRLDRIAAPTLVVASELDYTTVDAKQPIVELAQDARMVVVDGARHVLPVERPDEFNQMLDHWLREQRGD